MQVYLSNSERNRRYVNTEEGRIRELFKGAKHSAKQKNLSFTINHEDLFSLWKKQNKKCALSGVKMSTERHSDFLVSIDRKDNQRGYEKDNIQLICWPINRAKHQMSEESLLKWCALILSHRGKDFFSELS